MDTDLAARLTALRDAITQALPVLVASQQGARATSSVGLPSPAPYGAAGVPAGSASGSGVAFNNPVGTAGTAQQTVTTRSVSGENLGVNAGTSLATPAAGVNAGVNLSAPPAGSTPTTSASGFSTVVPPTQSGTIARAVNTNFTGSLPVATTTGTNAAPAPDRSLLVLQTYLQRALPLVNELLARNISGGSATPAAVPGVIAEPPASYGNVPRAGALTPTGR